MFGLIEKYKIRQLRREIKAKELAALRVQRDGYLRTYATMMLEIDTLYERLAHLTPQ